MINRKVEKTHDNNKGRGFKIEPDEKPASATLKPSNSAIDLSVKTKIRIKCSDPWRHIYPVTSKEGGHCGITIEAESSIFNIHSMLKVKNTPSSVSQITGASHYSPGQPGRIFGRRISSVWCFKNASTKPCIALPTKGTGGSKWG